MKPHVDSLQHVVFYNAKIVSTLCPFNHIPSMITKITNYHHSDANDGYGNKNWRIKIFQWHSRNPALNGCI